MVAVHLRRITRNNLQECLALQVDDSQKSLVATTAQSLAEAYVDSNLVPLAVYDAAARAQVLGDSGCKVLYLGYFNMRFHAQTRTAKKFSLY